MSDVTLLARRDCIFFDDVHGGTIYRDEMGGGPAAWTTTKSIILNVDDGGSEVRCSVSRPNAPMYLLKLCYADRWP